MINQPFLEKRAYFRFEGEIPLSYSALDSEERVKTQTYDLCVEGLCLFTQRRLTAGTYLDIEIEMPDNGEKIHRVGKVVWSNLTGVSKYRTGIKLEVTNLNPIPLILRNIRARRNSF